MYTYDSILENIYHIPINLCIPGPTWTILDAVASKKCNKVDIEWAWTVVVGSMLAPVAPILTGKLSVFNPINVHCTTGH